jgi:hypothetical protein
MKSVDKYNLFIQLIIAECQANISYYQSFIMDRFSGQPKIEKAREHILEEIEKI